MSHRNPLEALEPRTLLSVSLSAPPPTDPGVHHVGRTVYVNGSPDRDFIRILAAPDDAENNPRPAAIQVQVNGTQPVFRPGNMQRLIIRAGAGDDTIRIDAALPRTFHPRVLIIHGDEGNDTITGSDRGDRIFGDDGDDLIVGSTGNDQIQGGAGNDRLDGGYGGDRLFGGDGNDTVIGGPGADRMFGGAGDDTFHNQETDFERQQASARDLLHGGGGNDVAENGPFDRYRLITGRILTYSPTPT